MADWLGAGAAALLGGVLGAVGNKGKNEQTQTQDKAPWSAAQPYLLSLLGDAEALRKANAAQPFNPVEQGSMAAGWDNAKGGLFQLAPSMFDAGNKLASGQYNYNPMSNFDASGNFNFGAIGAATPDLSLKSPFVWQQNQHWSKDADPANWVPLGVSQSENLGLGEQKDQMAQMSDAQLQQLLARMQAAAKGA